MNERIRRALLSVSDKTGIVEFARGLTDLGIELISTGGTAAAIKRAGLPVTLVEEVTSIPEMLEGRVKTLHPAVHAGILFRRDSPNDCAELTRAGYEPIDLVCVNLYPFAAAVTSGLPVKDCIENIDIGGPAMIRSAAKNHEGVVVVVRPFDYEPVLQAMRASDGVIGLDMRRKLATKAFGYVAAYDARITEWMRAMLSPDEAFPEALAVAGDRLYECRYGENPHQRAAFYSAAATNEPCIARAEVVHGKELSFNNICDADAALATIKDFSDRPACVIMKHANPCGLAEADILVNAFTGALAGDPVSAYGGILAFSRRVDAGTARRATDRGLFFEVIIAPDYDGEALDLLKTRRRWGANVRILKVGELDGWREKAAGLEVRQVVGGYLVQDRDLKLIESERLQVVTKRSPSEAEMDEMLFAWKAVKHVKSNGIVLSKGKQIVGVGAGQMNRVQSVSLAVGQAGDEAKGSVMASDAFFPFADGPTVAADAGVSAIIQPGGSKRDQDTIQLCDERGITMVFTGMRHFRH